MEETEIPLSSEAFSKIKKSASKHSIPIQSLLDPEPSTPKQRSKPYPSRRNEATSTAEKKIAELPLPKGKIAK